MDLNLIWFILLGILLAGYAVLDGFDLGVGMLHLLARGDGERRVFVASIGPVWDGNEVWLVTFGGALFAAFPEAYATIFSGFYVVFMLVLLALISRAVSLDFRCKIKSTAWRRTCDVVFCISSASATLLFGVGVGNAMIGVPLDPRGIYTAGFFNLLGPYAITVGLLAVAMFAMHGAIFLHLKTTGELCERTYRWAWRTYGVFVLMYLVVTIATWLYVPRAMAPFQSNPIAWLVVAANLAAVIGIPCALYRHRSGWAFMASCLSICAFIILLGLTLFPNLVTSDPNLENSLTIYNAASSQKTLSIMLVIAVIGMPFVLTYTAIIYWVFRGRVARGDKSY
jgi:cytochrome d ubiquinol oxidase subunit II